MSVDFRYMESIMKEKKIISHTPHNITPVTHGLPAILSRDFRLQVIDSGD